MAVNAEFEKSISNNIYLLSAEINFGSVEELALLPNTCATCPIFGGNDGGLSDPLVPSQKIASCTGFTYYPDDVDMVTTLHVVYDHSRNDVAEYIMQSAACGIVQAEVIRGETRKWQGRIATAESKPKRRDITEVLDIKLDAEPQEVVKKAVEFFGNNEVFNLLFETEEDIEDRWHQLQEAIKVLDKWGYYERVAELWTYESGSVWQGRSPSFALVESLGHVLGHMMGYAENQLDGLSTAFIDLDPNELQEIVTSARVAFDYINRFDWDTNILS